MKNIQNIRFTGSGIHINYCVDLCVKSTGGYVYITGLHHWITPLDYITGLHARVMAIDFL